MSSGSDQQLPQARPLSIADENLAAELGHADPPPRPQPVIAREDHDEFLVEQLMQAEPVALDPLRDRQKRQVKLVCPEHLGQFLARLLADGQLNRRMALVEDRERERDVDRPHRVHRADRDVSGLHAAQPLQLAMRRLELCEDPPRSGDQELARIGDRDAPGGALSEREADLVLKATDLLGERRLGDVLTGRGSREALLLRERHEIAQLAQFHNKSLYISHQTDL